MANNTDPNNISIWEALAEGIGCFFSIIFILFVISIINWRSTKEFFDPVFKSAEREIKQKERHTIEGLVKESTMKVNQSTTFEIIFQDGRSITFANVPSKPVEKGKYYVFEYDGLNAIISMKEK